MTGEERGPPLRPRSILEILDAAFEASASEPGIVWLALLGMGPVALLSIVLWYGASEAVFDRGTETLVAFSAALAALWRHVPGGAITLLVEQHVRGTPLSVREALARALRRAPSLMAAGALSFWVTLLALPSLGLVLLFWGGVYLALPITLAREAPPWGVPRAARTLLGARGLAPVLLTALWFSGVVLLALDLWLALALGLSLAASLFDLDVALLSRLLSPDTPIFLPTIGAIALTLLECVRQASLALLHVDAKVRRDALDLEARIEAQAEALRPAATVRPGRGRAALLLLVLLLPRGAAAEAPVDRFVEVANRAIDAGANLEEDLDAEEANTVLALLPAEEATALGPLSEAIAADLDAGRVDDAERRLQAALREIRRFAEREAFEAVEVGPPIADPKALLDPILARPEFQRATRASRPKRSPDEMQEPSWLERFRRWLREMIDRLFGGDKKGRGLSSTDDLLLPAELSWILWAALLVIALLGVGVAVARALGAPSSATLDTPEEAAATGEQTAPEVPRYDALAQSPDAWLREADALAARGELREALRAAYLALLGILDRAGHIAYRSERTNWDYVRAFAGPQAAHARFRALTTRFEEAWYGFEAVSASDYRDVREGALDLASLASPAETPSQAGEADPASDVDTEAIS